MLPTSHNLLTQVERYLALHPQEHENLAALCTQLSAAQGDPFNRKTLPGHICCSGLVLTPDSRKVLFIHHRALNFWLQPGGHVEQDSSLIAAALREIAEETGITQLEMHPGQSPDDLPFDIHCHEVAARPEKSEGAHLHYDFCYLFTAPQESLTLQAEEVSGARWIERSELPAYAGLRLRERFIPKLDALL